MSSGNTRSSDALWSRLDKTELKSIKVAITRRNVSEPNLSGPILRSLDDPSRLVIHFRTDEGVRPIFDREDIIVNKETHEHRKVLTSPDKTRSRSPEKRHQKSPQAHCSRYRSRERSVSRVSIYTSPSRSKRSRSPTRRERTPPPKYYKRSSRSPYRSHRSRSPPPKGSSTRARTPVKYKSRSRLPEAPPRRRSRSYSPRHRRERYSRSPRRYERSRTRSPRSRRYSPSKRRRSPHGEKFYESRIPPNPYFEGAEFWIPNPMMQPRFIPRTMVPPGAFSYPFRPAMPPLVPAIRGAPRPRLVYNNRVIPANPRPAKAIESSTVITTTSTSTSGEVRIEEVGESSKEQESKMLEIVAQGQED